MNRLRLATQFGRRLCGAHEMTQPGQSGRIAPGTRPDVEDSAWSSWEKVHHVAMHIGEGDAFILFGQGRSIAVVPF